MGKAVGLCAAAPMAVVVMSYRQVVHAYPSGGGSYEVVSENLGANSGLVVAASLLVDYVMTVAVSVASILAEHRYLPRQMHTRGDRLAFSDGIIALAVVAGGLLWFYRADVTSLIHLYILGVFTSFTLSRIGMVRHWNRTLATETDPAVRGAAQRSARPRPRPRGRAQAPARTARASRTTRASRPRQGRPSARMEGVREPGTALTGWFAALAGPSPAPPGASADLRR